MYVDSFSDIEDEFLERVQRIVWCTVSTLDTKDRPRSRLLHPIWEGSTGWICTGRNTLKTKHLEHNPHVSLSYWDPKHEQAFVDCRAEWIDDPEEKKRLWELFKSTPEPYGYDPVLFWPGGPQDETFGLLKLTPWRIEVSSLAEMMEGKEAKVWMAPAQPPGS